MTRTGEVARRERRERRVWASTSRLAELSYDTFELSDFRGDPVEGFEFTSGATAYRYTSSDTAVTFAGKKLIGGLPMNPATNWFAGRS